MPTNSSNQPEIPSTPLTVFLRDPAAPQGPFYVRSKVANPAEIVDSTDEEIEALAHIIYNAYLEWKKQ